MIDSKEMNENVNNTQNQDTSRVVSGSIVSIENGEAKINFGENDVLKNEFAIIPVGRLAGDVAIGNIVKMRLEKKDGKMVVTEFLSHEKPNKNAGGESAETDSNKEVEGIVISANDNEVTVNFGLENDAKVPVYEFCTDVRVGDKVKLLVDKDGKIVKVTEVIRDIPFDAESYETEKPEIKEGEVRVIAINNITKTITLEFLDTKKTKVIPAESISLDGEVICGEKLIVDYTEDSTTQERTIKSYNRYLSTSVETEHPTDDEPDDEGNPIMTVKAEVVEIDDTEKNNVKLTLKFDGEKENVVIPLNVVRIDDVEVGCILSLEVEQEGEKRTIKSGKIESRPEDKIELRFIDKDFMLDVMSVPTHSKLEFRMVTFIMQWARRNNVPYEFDEYGNIYLTKGELDEGEYYPCVTSHLDTVQYKHDPYIYAGVPLSLKVEREKNGDHKLSVNNEGGSLGTEIGIGADDKAGVLICLSLFDHFEKLKACFFLDEETGCNGSDHLDEDWFKNVGYVVGFDSPDLYRAAWSCSGTKLFNYEFYEKWMKPICDEWGLKNCFYSEPYTDVKNIREKTDIICMNFGNGGYNAHNIGGTEYLIMEDTDYACGMAIDLIDYIGLTRHTLKHKKKNYTTSSGYVRDSNGN